jgi:hypothetical protein
MIWLSFEFLLRVASPRDLQAVHFGPSRFREPERKGREEEIVLSPHSEEYAKTTRQQWHGESDNHENVP